MNDDWLGDWLGEWCVIDGCVGGEWLIGWVVAVEWWVEKWWISEWLSCDGWMADA